MPRQPSGGSGGGTSSTGTTARNPVGPGQDPVSGTTARGGSAIPEVIDPGQIQYFRYPESAAATPERVLTATATILGNVVPEVFGEKEVTGYIGAIDSTTSSTLIYIGIIFAHGEQDSVTNVRINRESLTSPDWLNSYSIHKGDGTGISIMLTQMPNWDADDTTLWQSLAHIVLSIVASNADVPGALNVTATLGGKKFSDFRTTTTAAHTNAIDIGWYLRTSSDWFGNNAARLHSDTWEAVADWNDEQISTEDRYSWVGVLDRRDPDGALSDVLGLSLASEYVGPDGTVRLWCEMPPPRVPGLWSTVGGPDTTIIGSVSPDTSDLSVGSIVLFEDGSTEKVTAINGADEFEVENAVDITAEKIRLITDVHLSGDDWVSVPESRDIDLATIPDVVQVRYFGPTIGDEHVYPEDVTGFDKRTEVTVPGCTVPSQARRISETRRDVRKYQKIQWRATASAKAHGLIPGDVLRISDDVLDEQLVMVMPPVKVRKSGYVDLILRKFSLSAFSDGTFTRSWVPAPGGGWGDAYLIDGSSNQLVDGSGDSLVASANSIGGA